MAVTGLHVHGAMAQVIIHRALVHRQARAVYLVDLRLLANGKLPLSLSLSLKLLKQGQRTCQQRAASANASHNLQLEGQGEAVY